MTQSISILESDSFRNCCARMAEYSARLEESGNWPETSWSLLNEAGITNWFLPAECGGIPQPAQIQQLAYLELATSCLTTTFALTQRNAAVSRIIISDNDALRDILTHRLANHELFTTVGISHLTTSRQHLKDPILKASPSAGGWRLEGEIPWTTGADAAEIIVTGGIQPDGQQVLFALPTDLQGVTINEPPRLLALNESMTTSVRLESVDVPSELRLLGPIDNVLATGSTGGVTTSVLALGAAQKSIQGLESESRKRPDLEPTALELRSTLEELRQKVIEMTHDNANSADTEDREALRKQSNSLVLKSAQAFLTASKGAGFLAHHPASRAVREAQFFLVWSCPQNVMAAALAEFACVTLQ